MKGIPQTTEIKAMNTTQTTLETIEFRRLLLANGIVDPSPYEWLDGEAWYRGEPIENRQSDGERAAIDEMRR